MTQVSVRCSTARGSLLDRRAANVEDLIDARDYATRVARSLIAIPNSRDCVNVGLALSTIWETSYL
jgi:hypothetical protein